MSAPATGLVRQALTLTQPWASLSVVPLRRPCPVHGSFLGTDFDVVIPPGQPPKRHETRGWRLGRAQLPLRLAIHAAKGHAGLRQHIILPSSMFAWRYRAALLNCGLSVGDPWLPDYPSLFRAEEAAPLPLGAVVGVVTITAIVPTDTIPSLLLDGRSDALDVQLGDWGPGRWAWRMEDAVALERPIPCRGFQMLWDLPPEVQSELDAQLAAGAAP